MNIVACIKRVPTTETQVKIDTDGKSLETSGYQYMTSFYDDLAVEQAILTKEAVEGEVTVVTLSSKDATKEVRECLAKGADRGVILLDENWLDRDARATAIALSAQIKNLGAELAFFGRVATDRDNNAVGPMVATLLGWACVSEVIEIEITAEGGTAKRETESGIETVSFSLPAVVTCNKGLNEPRYAGLKGIMAAKKKPVEEIAVELESNQAEVMQVALPPARKAGRTVESVEELISALRDEAKVL